MSNLNEEIGKALHQLLSVGEELIDEGRRAVSKRLGTNRPGHIASYGGYSDRHGTHLAGRILEKAPGGGPGDHDTIWQNLGNTLRRWESDEVAGVEVHARFETHEASATSDEEGYYQITFPKATHAEGLWTTAEARVNTAGDEIHAIHDILVVPPSASFGVISDLDDTVIHTGITSVLLAAKLTFLENAKTRKPLEGVAELYAALQNGTAGMPVNPIFYISSSPWNLYDLLADFLQLNSIPKGPIFLRDLGLDRAKFIKEKGHGHKLEKALRVLDGYPHLPFVLVGDSGQEDPEIYAQLCEQHPERIRAVYIRDVDPELESARDSAVLHAAARVEAQGIPMILAADSMAMAVHAGRMGLIPEVAVPEVIEEAGKDRERPGAGEQAIQDAVDSIGT